MEASVAELRHAASALPPAARALVEEEFIDRDLSWLEFNYRVLNEALDPRTPLLERVRFLIIFSSNLDEFVMKRVAALREEATPGKVSLTPGVITPQHLLPRIRQAILE